jgi:acetylornithine deacetylase/succinyl-diaminopimelate desuccinylase-like protein
MTTSQTYLEQNKDRHLEELFEFIRIPSVSAMNVHIPDVYKAAEWVVKKLGEAGIEHVEIMPTAGHPIVYGDWLHAGADKPTVLIYGHFDVQPPDPLDLWESPPFEPEIRNGRIYGRGASDDKGGMFTPIIAVEAYLKTIGSIPVNVKFCFEGQEEIGSPQLRQLIANHKDKFACDLVLSSDGVLWDGDTPMLLTGLKGLTAFELHVTGPSSDLHSGLGGVLMNPLEALSRVIATMRHPDGKIAIEGFYDDVRELTDAERIQFSDAPYDENEHKTQLGIDDFFGEPGYSNRERNWARPTLDINGMWGGFQGDGTKTVIPSKAYAKFTCRLVEYQDPDKIIALIKIHVAKHTPSGVMIEFIENPGKAQPYHIPNDHPVTNIVGQVLAEVFNVEPHYARVGGSIPVTEYFRESLDAYTFNFGWTAMDENLHAPNEFIRVRNFERGQRAYCLILEKLASQPLTT